MAEDKTITFTPAALTTLDNIGNRVAQVSDFYGQDSPEYRRVVESAFGSLLSVIRLGGRVMSDGDMALVADSFITYGVVPFRFESANKELREVAKNGPELVEWSVHS